MGAIFAPPSPATSATTSSATSQTISSFGRRFRAEQQQQQTTTTTTNSFLCFALLCFECLAFELVGYSSMVSRCALLWRRLACFSVSALCRLALVSFMPSGTWLFFRFCVSLCASFVAFGRACAVRLIQAFPLLLYFTICRLTFYASESLSRNNTAAFPNPEQEVSHSFSAPPLPPLPLLGSSLPSAATSALFLLNLSCSVLSLSPRYALFGRSDPDNRIQLMGN